MTSPVRDFGDLFRITFQNTTSRDVDAYWIDPEGFWQRDGTVAAGQVMDTSTYVDRVWVFTRDGYAIQHAITDRSFSFVEIRKQVWIRWYNRTNGPVTVGRVEDDGVVRFWETVNAGVETSLRPASDNDLFVMRRADGYVIDTYVAGSENVQTKEIIDNIVEVQVTIPQEQNPPMCTSWPNLCQAWKEAEDVNNDGRITAYDIFYLADTNNDGRVVPIELRTFFQVVAANNEDYPIEIVNIVEDHQSGEFDLLEAMAGFDVTLAGDPAPCEQWIVSPGGNINVELCYAEVPGSDD